MTERKSYGDIQTEKDRQTYRQRYKKERHTQTEKERETDIQTKRERKKILIERTGRQVEREREQVDR